MPQNKLLLYFLSTIVFCISLSVLLLELALTRIFSIILYYDYAFMVISIAFFGLGIGSLLVYIIKDRSQQNLPSLIIKSTVGFTASIAAFLFLIMDLPSEGSSIIYLLASTGIPVVYLFYIISSIPFFFAGIALASIFLSMSKEISKLYFFDLVGASVAALLLDFFMRELGAESLLLTIGLLALLPAVVAAITTHILQKANGGPNTKMSIRRTDSRWRCFYKG